MDVGRKETGIELDRVRERLLRLLERDERGGSQMPVSLAEDVPPLGVVGAPPDLLLERRFEIAMSAELKQAA